MESAIYHQIIEMEQFCHHQFCMNVLMCVQLNHHADHHTTFSYVSPYVIPKKILTTHSLNTFSPLGIFGVMHHRKTVRIQLLGRYMCVLLCSHLRAHRIGNFLSADDKLNHLYSIKSCDKDVHNGRRRRMSVRLRPPFCIPIG